MLILSIGYFVNGHGVNSKVAYNVITEDDLTNVRTMAKELLFSEQYNNWNYSPTGDDLTPEQLYSHIKKDVLNSFARICTVDIDCTRIFSLSIIRGEIEYLL